MWKLKFLRKVKIESKTSSLMQTPAFGTDCYQSQNKCHLTDSNQSDDALNGLKFLLLPLLPELSMSIANPLSVSGRFPFQTDFWLSRGALPVKVSTLILVII